MHSCQSCTQPKWLWFSEFMEKSELDWQFNKKKNIFFCSNQSRTQKGQCWQQCAINIRYNSSWLTSLTPLHSQQVTPLMADWLKNGLDGCFLGVCFPDSWVAILQVTLFSQVGCRRGSYSATFRANQTAVRLRQWIGVPRIALHLSVQGAAQTPNDWMERKDPQWPTRLFHQQSHWNV